MLSPVAATATSLSRPNPGGHWRGGSPCRASGQGRVDRAWLVLTEAGQRELAAASRTCEAEMAAALDAVLSPDEQRLAHAHVARLLAAQQPA